MLKDYEVYKVALDKDATKVIKQVKEYLNSRREKNEIKINWVIDENDCVEWLIYLGIKQFKFLHGARD